MPDWLFFLYLAIIAIGTIIGIIIGARKGFGGALCGLVFGFFGGMITGVLIAQVLNLFIYRIIIPIISAIIWFITTYWLPIIGVCAIVASLIYAATHPDEIKMLSAYIMRLCGTVVSNIKMSDRMIMRYAAKQTKKLIAIAPDIEWHDIRTSINEIGTIHIVSLLHERNGLRAAIKRIRGVLKQVEWQKPDRGDIEMANARRSAQTVEMLVVKLQKNEKDIAEALDMLQHLEADLAAASVDEYCRDEIKAKLRGLVSRIQQNSAEVQAARTESDDYARQRQRRLTE